MPSAAEALFLNSNRFIGGQAFEDDFKAHDFFVADFDRAAFANGQDHSFADFQSVQLSPDGLGECFGILKTFDGDEATAKSGRRFQALDFGDAKSYLAVADGDRFPS